jgi:hypothetical protein
MNGGLAMGDFDKHLERCLQDPIFVEEYEQLSMDKKRGLEFKRALSEAEMNEKLEKGYADMKAGRTKPASKVFADIRKEYDL